MKSTMSKAALLACAALYVMPAAAQTNPATQADPVQVDPAAPQQDPTAPEARDANNADATNQEIIVTGSRTITNGNNAPTPVTVVSPQQLAVTRPGRVFETLDDLPVFSGSRGVTNPPTNSQPNQGSSVSALNLRNLGALRVLALFDGRRLPPTTADGYVSTNAIPQMLLQRVDIVTGGASAIYGSDAVSGVVNFITDRNFEGVRVDLQNGISSHGDDYSYQSGVAVGTKLFGGRGHFEASYQRIYDEGIPHKTARDWAGRNYTVQGNGTTIPWHLQDNALITILSFGGLIVCPSGTTASAFLDTPVPTACASRPMVGYTFDENGVATPFERGQRGAAAGLADSTIQLGGDGAYHNWPSLKSKIAVDQAFARFDFEVTDSVHFWAEGSYTHDFTRGHPSNLRFFGQGVNIGACNAFLAPQYQATLGCTAANNNINSTQPTFTFNKTWNYELNPNAFGTVMDIDTKSHFVMAGFDGKLGENFKWELGYTQSQSNYEVAVEKNMNMRNVNAALDAVRDPATNQIVCRVSLTQYASLYPGCVPINLFGPSTETKAMFDYIFQPVHHETVNKLDDFSGSISGSPFGLWAGPVEVALTGEYRKQTYELRSDSLPTERQDCLGIRYNCVAGSSPLNINQFAIRSPVQQAVAEVAGEVTVPLLRDISFAKSLSFNGGVRYARYTNTPNDGVYARTTFNATTWKAGATWTPFDLLTIRVGRSRDIRAPNLYDLYAPSSIAQSTSFDYLLSRNVNAQISSGGNPNLKPEIANTLTLGAVVRPMTGLSFSIDYYNIQITEALAQISGASQAVQQACYDSNGSSPLCTLLVRGTAGPLDRNTQLSLIYSRPVNIAAQKARGFDFETNYRTTIGGQNFSLRGLVTYQPTLIYSAASLPTNNQAGISYNSTYSLSPTPKVKASLFLHYDVADWFSLDISERWRSKLRLGPTELANGGTTAVVGDIPPIAYTNVTMTFRAPRTWGDYAFFLNVQNLFDKDPPPAGLSQLNQFQPGYPPNGWAIGDDVVGRYFTAGVRMKF